MIELEQLRGILERNGFSVFVVEDESRARAVIVERILPETGAKLVSYGDSLTVKATGVLDELRDEPAIEFIEVFPPDRSVEEKTELKRQALHSDVFITGTNAVTEAGQLVNLDSLGNRVAGITFGPKRVVIVVGRNKIVPTLEDAMERIKHRTAPANARRLNKKTPCAQTGACEDCSSADRICNTWTITEKSKPAGRICVVLVNRDLGLSPRG